MPFVVDYLALTFVASCGVIQLAASYSGLKGLYFFKTQTLNLVAGLLLTIAAFVWFFTFEPRNLPDTGGGLDANQQATLCAAGSMLGVVFTLISSSLLRRRMRSSSLDTLHGLESLRNSNFYWAFITTVRGIWTR